MVDDGVPSRGHRNNIFKPEFNMVGIGCGPHKEFRCITVLDYAGGMTSKGAKGNTGVAVGEVP